MSVGKKLTFFGFVYFLLVSPFYSNFYEWIWDWGVPLIILIFVVALYYAGFFKDISFDP